MECYPYLQIFYWLFEQLNTYFHGSLSTNISAKKFNFLFSVSFLPFFVNGFFKIWLLKPWVNFIARDYSGFNLLSTLLVRTLFSPPPHQYSSPHLFPIAQNFVSKSRSVSLQKTEIWFRIFCKRLSQEECTVLNHFHLGCRKCWFFSVAFRSKCSYLMGLQSCKKALKTSTRCYLILLRISL